MLKSRIIAFLMLLFAIAFFIFAITHPTASFPWNNTITYLIYAVYFLVIIFLLITSHKKKK